MNKKNELWDLYNINRQALGRTHIRGEKIEAGAYHIVVHLLIFNSKGELLIQHRASTKGSLGNLWDISVGGSAIQGEDSLAGIKRECHEELGLEYSDDSFQFVLTQIGSDYFDDFYIVHDEVDANDLQLQEEEVQDAMWADKEYVLSLIEKNKFVPWSAVFIEYLFTVVQKKVFAGQSVRYKA